MVARTPCLNMQLRCKSWFRTANKGATVTMWGLAKLAGSLHTCGLHRTTQQSLTRRRATKPIIALRSAELEPLQYYLYIYIYCTIHAIIFPIYTILYYIIKNASVCCVPRRAARRPPTSTDIKLAQLEMMAHPGPSYRDRSAAALDRASASCGVDADEAAELESDLEGSQQPALSTNADER